MDQELSTAAQQIDQELAQALASHLSSFEDRQRKELGKVLDQEIQLEERELQQLAQEIDLQTKELSHRFAQLEASPEVVATMIRSAEEGVLWRPARHRRLYLRQQLHPVHGLHDESPHPQRRQGLCVLPSRMR